MKRYHECAVIKDGNKRVGYFVQDTGGEQLKNGGMGSPWILLGSEDFENLVKSNQVQYLVYNNGIKCRYTDEEKSYLLKMPGVKQSFIDDTEKDYFNMDCTFSYKHVNIASNGYPAVACSVGEVTRMFGQNLVLLYFYGLDNNINRLYQDICYQLPNFSNMLICNGNIMRATIPLIFAERIFASTSIMVLFNTSTLKFMRNRLDRTPRIKLIQKSPSDSDLNSAINLFDNFTNTFLNVLNIS